MSFQSRIYGYKLVGRKIVVSDISEKRSDSTSVKCQKSVLKIQLLVLERKEGCIILLLVLEQKEGCKILLLVLV